MIDDKFRIEKYPGGTFLIFSNMKPIETKRILNQNQKLFNAIEYTIEKQTDVDITAYQDMFDFCVSSCEENKSKEVCRMAHQWSKRLRNLINKNLPRSNNPEEMFELYNKSLLFDAPVDFDSYMLYLEKNRKPKDRFYQPRRKQLMPIVIQMQKLLDDELDELFVSQPPRTGKSTLSTFFTTMLMGRNSESSNLYSAYSDYITSSFYTGVMEVLTDSNTYTWNEIFPNCKIAQTDAKEETINIDRRKKYPSLTCRSLSGTLNGACDCNGCLIADDLISGIDEALNPDRLNTAWNKVTNNLITRAKENAKIIWIGTRWSLYDPIGKRIQTLQDSEKFKNRRYKVINVPALNEYDESNFDYDYGVGYSTEHYQQIRSSFETNDDMASWNAQYMGEPIERMGAVFSSSDFKYFDGTLPEEPSRIFFAVDPAFGGGDSVSGPICFECDGLVYVPDVIHDNSSKEVTQPKIAMLIMKYGVKNVRFECSAATKSYAEGVQKILKERKFRCTIETKNAPNTQTKIQKIFDRAPDIRERMVFLEMNKRSSEYQKFMNELFAFKIEGKNKHDDAPDSCAQAMDMCLGGIRTIQVFDRPF